MVHLTYKTPILINNSNFFLLPFGVCLVLYQSHQSFDLYPFCVRRNVELKCFAQIVASMSASTYVQFILYYIYRASKGQFAQDGLKLAFYTEIQYVGIWRLWHFRQILDLCEFFPFFLHTKYLLKPVSFLYQRFSKWDVLVYSTDSTFIRCCNLISQPIWVDFQSNE